MGYEVRSMREALTGNSYPGRGIVVGKSADGTKAVYAYFIMGRSENSHFCRGRGKRHHLSL